MENAKISVYVGTPHLFNIFFWECSLFLLHSYELTLRSNENVGLFILHIKSYFLIGTIGIQSVPQAFSGNFPIRVQQGYKSYLGHVACGEEATLQENSSDVSLIIPRNVYCKVKTAIHTHYEEIVGKLPEDECLVAPIVEISCKMRKLTLLPQPFEVRIPHCLKDQDLSKLIIRAGDIHKGAPFEIIGQEQYTVNKTHVTLFTHTFSQIICSACEGKCTYNIGGFLFGSNFREDPTAQTCKTRLYLCGPLYDLKEFREVSVECKNRMSNLSITFGCCWILNYFKS